jgi:uncharacterized protein
VRRPVRSGVYIGSLRHRRTAPVTHAFTYPLFMVLLDIDRIPALMRVSAFTSLNRWNWASFHDGDHLGEPAVPLRERLARDAAHSGHTLPDGPIFLLTHLRYLGYGFNPVSFFYCYDTSGALRLILAEVNNTFGGSHTYWLEPGALHSESPGTVNAPGTFRAVATKSFYVSPFMPADMRYTFAFTEPSDRLVAHMALERCAVTDTPHVFDATLMLDYRPWTARELRRVLLRHPFMTATVIAGIHWQALRLWWKGLPIVPRSTPDGVYPDNAVPDAGRP